MLDRRRKRILDGVLGNIDVPERARQDGYGAAVLAPEHPGNVRLGRCRMSAALTHGSPPTGG